MQTIALEIYKAIVQILIGALLIVISSARLAGLGLGRWRARNCKPLIVIAGLENSALKHS